MFCQRTFSNGEETRHLYVLHALNHVIKYVHILLHLLLLLILCLFFQRQRTRVLKHNSQLQAAMKDGRQLRWGLSFLFLTAIFHVYCSDLRDQGITRPKVLILLPFREAALRTVNIMIQLLGKVCLCLCVRACTIMCCVFPSVKWPITSDF